MIRRLIRFIRRLRAQIQIDGWTVLLNPLTWRHAWSRRLLAADVRSVLDAAQRPEAEELASDIHRAITDYRTRHYTDPDRILAHPQLVVQLDRHNLVHREPEPGTQAIVNLYTWGVPLIPTTSVDRFELRPSDEAWTQAAQNAAQAFGTSSDQVQAPRALSTDDEADA